MSKNIGIFTYDFYPFIGGMGRYVYEFYLKLKDIQDFNFFVFSPAKNNLPGHLPVFKETQNSMFKNIGFSAGVNLAIKPLIKKYGLRIAHLFGGPGGVFLLGKPGIPVVYTACHTYYQQCRLIPRQGWKRVLVNFEQTGYRLAERVISISKDTEDILVNKYGISRDKIELIPPFADREKFHRLPNIEKIKNGILFVGRLDNRKGISFLVKSMPLVIRENPDAKLFIVGEGQLLNSLRAFVMENNLGKNIKFLGFVQDEELLMLYNQVDIVVVPSVFEGFGITVIEAMSCGAPVIGTNVEGIKGIIKGNENGILVNYNDCNELAKRIVGLLDNAWLRTEFSRKGLETIEGKFSPDRIVNRIINLYHRL